jgi:hypothetical protein
MNTCSECYSDECEGRACLDRPESVEMATDSGPACVCGGTIYHYVVDAEPGFTRFDATCVSCNRTVERTSKLRLTTVAEVRDRHHGIIH